MKQRLSYKTIRTTRLAIVRVKAEYGDDLCEEYRKSLDRVSDLLRDIEDDLQERTEP